MIAALVLRLFFLLRLIIIAAGQTPAYSPTDTIFLNCGSSSDTTPGDGRNWEGDSLSKFSPPNIGNVSTAARALEGNPSITEIPYMTARVFPSQFTYIFPVSPGPKFLRLYFYPATYSTFDKTLSYFTVKANEYTLLSNFSAFLTVSDQKVASIVKEFIVNVKDNQIINLTFAPSPNSYSFVNGIEIISVPNNLYSNTRVSINNPLKSVNWNTLFDFNQNNTAFETLYRLNVGGTAVAAVNDTGMFREWALDDNFIFGGAPSSGNPLFNSDIRIQYSENTPNYSAPEIVYETARAMGTMTRFNNQNNLTWVFPAVDSGFYYLLRLHFCEINPDLVTEQGQRVFTIYINNRTADPAFDVIFLAGGPGTPMFRDFVLWVPPIQSQDRRPGKQNLWLALSPSRSSMYADAILNGLEIFKLNSSDANLAGPNPELAVNPTIPAPNKSSSGSRSRSRIIYAVVGAVIGAFALFSALGFLIFRRRKRAERMEKSSTKSSWVPISTTSRSTKTSSTGSSLPSDLCRHFLLDEIKSATANFNDEFVIGKGGFGNVYKGYIDNGVTTVAIKRLDPSSRQGAHEFQTEIEMLSKLRHVHLVSLIGYCDEKHEMILVYDFMANGTLRDHLYKSDNPPLTWNQRLQICIGAAKGLHYLHSGAKHNIIHRDVKSTNILLDEKWVAKVSDFGLSKSGPTGGDQTHVSTVVKGSFGYVDPEYYRRRQLTDKSDVYSFGVVLFEVICSRPVIIHNASKERVNLAEWARRCYKNGSIEQIIDNNIRDQIAKECLVNYVELAMGCLNDRGLERPSMNDVVWRLEFALQLQEAAEKIERLNGDENDHTAMTTDDDQLLSGSGEDGVTSSSSSSLLRTATSMATGDTLNSHSVFSEIRNSDGR